MKHIVYSVVLCRHKNEIFKNWLSDSWEEGLDKAWIGTFNNAVVFVKETEAREEVQRYIRRVTAVDPKTTKEFLSQYFIKIELYKVTVH